MTTMINREGLLATLLSIRSGLSTKANAPEQSDSFVFDDGQVMTFNSEIAVRAKSGISKKFKVAIKGKRLLSFLKEKKEEEIGMDLVGDQLILTGSRTKTEISVESEISLDIATVGEPEQWLSLPESFTQALEIVGGCTEKERQDGKFDQVCIHLHPKWVEAWGKDKMARYRMKLGLTESQMVRQASIRHILAFNMNEFGLSDAWIHFRNSANLVFSFRRFLTEEFPYPNLTKFYEIEGGVELKLPKALPQAAKEAGLFSAEDPNNDKIFIKIMPGKMRVQGFGVGAKHTSWLNLKYSGESRLFAIPPKLIGEISNKHNVVTLKKGMLRVDGKRWSFLASLASTERSTSEVNDD